MSRHTNLHPRLSKKRRAPPLTSRPPTSSTFMPGCACVAANASTAVDALWCQPREGGVVAARRTRAAGASCRMRFAKRLHSTAQPCFHTFPHALDPSSSTQGDIAPNGMGPVGVCACACGHARVQEVCPCPRVEERSLKWYMKSVGGGFCDVRARTAAKTSPLRPLPLTRPCRSSQ
jgi:hypothetical protein